MASKAAYLTESNQTMLKGKSHIKPGQPTINQRMLGWGLNLSSVHLEGQLLPGISLVRSFDGPSRGLPIITFPGNLGDPSSLLQVWELLEAR